MGEIKRWKLKGFIPGVEGESEAMFQPTVVLAEDLDGALARKALLESAYVKAGEREHSLRGELATMTMFQDNAINKIINLRGNLTATEQRVGELEGLLRDLLDKPPHTRQEGYREAMGKFSDLLGKPLCPDCSKPATQHHGEPAVLPEGYCLMPRSLTAENGAKALLIGEFKLKVTMDCPECCELEEASEGCEICGGEGEYIQQHTIPWEQIKFIYSEAVRGLARNNEAK